jgi:protein required for attachment to host cells
MEIYKNIYTEHEDQMMWELHDIRQRLHKERKNKTIEEINRDALKKYSEWLKEIAMNTKRA